MKNNNYLTIFYSISHWHSKSCRLSFACWPTSPAGFSRPRAYSTSKKQFFGGELVRPPS